MKETCVNTSWQLLLPDGSSFDLHNKSHRKCKFAESSKHYEEIRNVAFKTVGLLSDHFCFMLETGKSKLRFNLVVACLPSSPTIIESLAAKRMLLCSACQTYLSRGLEKSNAFLTNQINLVNDFVLANEHAIQLDDKQNMAINSLLSSDSAVTNLLESLISLPELCFQWARVKGKSGKAYKLRMCDSELAICDDLGDSSPFHTWSWLELGQCKVSKTEVRIPWFISSANNNLLPALKDILMSPTPSSRSRNKSEETASPNSVEGNLQYRIVVSANDLTASFRLSHQLMCIRAMGLRKNDPEHCRDTHLSTLSPIRLDEPVACKQKANKWLCGGLYRKRSRRTSSKPILSSEVENSCKSSESTPTPVASNGTSIGIVSSQVDFSPPSGFFNAQTRTTPVSVPFSISYPSNSPDSESPAGGEAEAEIDDILVQDLNMLTEMTSISSLSKTHTSSNAFRTNDMSSFSANYDVGPVRAESPVINKTCSAAPNNLSMISETFSISANTEIKSGNMNVPSQAQPAVVMTTYSDVCRMSTEFSMPPPPCEGDVSSFGHAPDHLPPEDQSGQLGSESHSALSVDLSSAGVNSMSPPENGHQSTIPPSLQNYSLNSSNGHSIQNRDAPYATSYNQPDDTPIKPQSSDETPLVVPPSPRSPGRTISGIPLPRNPTRAKIGAAESFFKSNGSLNISPSAKNELPNECFDSSQTQAIISPTESKPPMDADASIGLSQLEKSQLTETSSNKVVESANANVVLLSTSILKPADSVVSNGHSSVPRRKNSSSLSGLADPKVLINQKDDNLSNNVKDYGESLSGISNVQSSGDSSHDQQPGRDSRPRMSGIRPPLVVTDANVLRYKPANSRSPSLASQPPPNSRDISSESERNQYQPGAPVLANRSRTGIEVPCLSTGIRLPSRVTRQAIAK